MRRALLCLALSAAALSAETPNQQALLEAQRGLDLARKSDYPAAIEAYRRAIALDPNIPGIDLNLGLAWFKLGKFPEAIDSLKRENARAPAVQVSTLLAMSYYGLRQFKEAAAWLEPVAQRQSDNTELSLLLANCYLWSGQYPEAMAVFQALLKRDPNSAAVHMLLGEALDAYHRTPDAIAEFEAAAKQAPTQADVHFGLGYLYWKEKRYADAQREFRAELKNNPKHAQALAYLGDALMQTGNAADAAEYLKSAVAAQHNLSLPHLDLGILYADRGTYEAAVAEFHVAAALDPKGFGAHYRLARLYRQLGQTADADAEFAIVQKLHEKKDAQPLFQLRAPR